MATFTVARDSLRNWAQYLPDGDAVAAAIRAVTNSLPRSDRLADDFGFYAVEGISTTKAEIDDDPGATPLVIVAQSTGTKCYIHLHNVDADSVTAGVDVDFVIPVAATAGEVTVLACMGASWMRFWDTGLTISASTTTETSSAPTNTPNVYMLYTGA